MNINSNKALYLKYFPVHGEYTEVFIGNRDVMEEGDERDKGKNCIYCGSIHVRQYDSDNFLLCEECRAQIISREQEFADALCQVRGGLEALMDISIAYTLTVTCRRTWLQQSKRYFGKKKEKSNSFGKDFVRCQKSKTAITFIVYEGMPRSTFMYITAGYIIGFFLEENVPRLLEIMAYRPMKYAVMKWCALHYMYINGYTDYCQWKAWKESGDSEYNEWVEELGEPLKNCSVNNKDILNRIKKKIAEQEEKDKLEREERIKSEKETSCI